MHCTTKPIDYLTLVHFVHVQEYARAAKGDNNLEGRVAPSAS